MAPRTFNSCWCIIACITVLLTGTVKGQDFSDVESLTILQRTLLNADTIAYRLYLSKPDSSIRLASEALEVSQKNKFNELAGLNYYILSKAHWAKANYRLSAEFGFKALKVFENTRHTTLWGKSLLSLARTFVDLHNHNQGAVYIERALDLSRERNASHLLAEAYREKSMLLSEMKSYDSALAYADKGLALFQQWNDTINVSILYGRKAKIYFFQKDYRRSTQYNKRALLLDSLAGNRRALGISYYQAALDAIHLQKMDSAVVLLKRSIPINREIRNLLTLTKVHALLADIYIEQKRHDLAARELKIVSQYKDSLYHTERGGQIQEMLSLYELSSKEETIEQLAQDNFQREQQVRNQRWFVAFLLLCVGLLGLAIFFLTRYRRLQEKTNLQLESKNQAIEQQKEEIQAQAETLQHLNDLKSKLFSVISHDLRGPMATLHSLLDLLSRQKLSHEEFITVSEKLKDNMEVTQRTLDNLLSWSLSQMEGIKTETKNFNISDIIKETSHLMLHAADQKKITIVTEVEPDLQVSADADQLLVILRNLLHNAIKFSNPGDSVLVSASRQNEFCRISIRDFGIGMLQHEIDMIVGSTKHFSKAGTLQEKGTGLGLLLCKEFIKLNGGELDIRSSVNQGTDIIFTVPLATTYLAKKVPLLN
jgi:two-component system, sensor histidine kinase and response regulator